jgi:hypothetical protein
VSVDTVTVQKRRHARMPGRSLAACSTLLLPVSFARHRTHPRDTWGSAAAATALARQRPFLSMIDPIDHADEEHALLGTQASSFGQPGTALAQPSVPNSIEGEPRGV